MKILIGRIRNKNNDELFSLINELLKEMAVGIILIIKVPFNVQLKCVTCPVTVWVTQWPNFTVRGILISYFF